MVIYNSVQQKLISLLSKNYLHVHFVKDEYKLSGFKVHIDGVYECVV